MLVLALRLLINSIIYMHISVFFWLIYAKDRVRNCVFYLFSSTASIYLQTLYKFVVKDVKFAQLYKDVCIHLHDIIFLNAGILD